MKLNLTFKHWLHGVRFYIACFSILIALETWWWAHATFGGTALFAIRIEEVYAWISVSFLSGALLIGPVLNIFPKLPGRSMLRDARRLLGVSAGLFASLHVLIAYDALFKFSNPLKLPSNYQQAFLYGFAALVILLAMVVTSFDAAFNAMGKWWFRLHRLVYAAALLILFHAFMIGTHAASWISLVILTIVGLLVFSFHTYTAIVRSDTPSIWQLLTIGSSALLLIAVFNYGYGQQLGYNPIEGKHAHQH